MEAPKTSDRHRDLITASSDVTSIDGRDLSRFRKSGSIAWSFLDCLILIERSRCSAISELNKGDTWTHLMRRSPSDGGRFVRRWIPIGRWIASNEVPRSTRDRGPIGARSWPDQRAIVARSALDRGPINARSWLDRRAIVACSTRDRGPISARSWLIQRKIASQDTATSNDPMTPSIRSHDRINRPRFSGQNSL